MSFFKKFKIFNLADRDTCKGKKCDYLNILTLHQEHLTAKHISHTKNQLDSTQNYIISNKFIKHSD